VNLDGNSSDRANIAGNPHLDPNRSRNDVMNMWFNTAAFVSPVTGQDGNAARNLLDSPGSKNADIALFRDFPIRENIKLQFRAEMTNAFNIVNLSNPDGNLNSKSFGTIRTAGAMRQSQLGLRLSF
jgi:hypothetical protein